MQRVRRRSIVAATLAAACVGAPRRARAADGAAPDAARPFDAARAWAEWVDLLRLDYAYFERPGVDGPAIVAAFAPRAAALATRAEFIALLQQMARNFADPHLQVGPGAPDGPSLVPTASDLHAQVRDGRCVIGDVRADSDAVRQGVLVGDVVLAIDGVAPAAAVQRWLGQPPGELSRVQLAHGFDIALAGVRERPRELVLEGRSGRRTVQLRSAGEQARALAAAPALSHERRGDVGLIRLHNSLGRNDTIAMFAEAVRSLIDTRALLIDLRNTPSGGNSTVARGVLGHFVARERPYQVHTVPGEARRHGVPRKFVEYVLPLQPRYRARAVVLAGRWTGSMGEGMVIGFDAIGVQTAGAPMGRLLGALFHETLVESGAQVELGEEQLFHVDGAPREAFVPRLHVEPAEAGPQGDPTLEAALRWLSRDGAR